MKAAKSTHGSEANDTHDNKKESQSNGGMCPSMMYTTPYASARGDLLRFLRSSGFKPHPLEVFCPSSRHCWVDVAAARGPDLWAFEYKSRSDSIRRGFEQCQSYARSFNYVVLVADRHRVTSSPYFSKFKRKGFGVWRHNGSGFYSIVPPIRRRVAPEARGVVERQFRKLRSPAGVDMSILEWVRED